jgi:hypothetical protein
MLDVRVVCLSAAAITVVQSGGTMANDNIDADAKLSVDLKLAERCCLLVGVSEPLVPSDSNSQWSNPRSRSLRRSDDE